MKKRVITAILVALIATSSIVVAFAASGKQGYISPKAILPGSITSLHIKDEDIQAADIGSNAVTNAEMADNAVTTDEIAGDAITDADIANNAVKTGEIAGGAVKNADIGTGAVKTGNIYLDTIGSGDIANNAVKTDEINANAVTEAKIGSGAVTSGKIGSGAVGSTEILDEEIDDKDLDDAAIPSVVLCTPGDKTGLDDTWWQDFNTTISTERKMAFIFTYAANLTNTTSGNALLAKACVVGQDNPTKQTYIAEPSPVRVADDDTAKIQRIVTFTNSSVSAGDYYVNASVRTTKADGTYTNITDRVFTVIALPTA